MMGPTNLKEIALRGFNGAELWLSFQKTYWQAANNSTRRAKLTAFFQCPLASFRLLAYRVIRHDPSLGSLTA